MPQGVPITLTENATVGLFCIQRYRFLTIGQFARIACLHRSTAVTKLRLYEEQGFLGHFGNTGVRGYGKTPKAYFLTRKGWELLSSESGVPPELLGGYKEVKVEAAWSPQMYHRLATVDLLIALECAVLQRPHLAIVKTFLEYRRVKRGERIVQETTDYVDTTESPETKIIPDATFVLENRESKARALYFLEMDMATERITSAYTTTKQTVLHQKFSQYDRYLKSFRYTNTYQEYGEFRAFTMLFVTLTETRIENVRDEADKKRQGKLKDARVSFVAEMRQKAEQLDLTLSEVVELEEEQKTRRGRRGSDAVVRIKYRSPQGDTWSGRGRIPVWLRKLEEDGHKREEYLVAEV